MIDTCVTDQLGPLPKNGQWIWDETKNTLVYKSLKKERIKNKATANPTLKIDFRTPTIHYRFQNRPYEQIIKAKDKNRITLLDIIQATLNVMSDMFYIPIEFEEYLRMKPVHEFLLYLLNYFYWFLDMNNHAAPLKPQQIDRSNREKDRIRLAYAHVLAALDELACKYAALLLGTNLKNFHHMRNGDLFYSCTEIDQTIFESLFVFTIYFTWITFYRQKFDLIRSELARLFRANSDMDLLTLPIAESLEGRLKTNLTLNSMNRHRLIDCGEHLSKVLAERAVMARASDTNTQRKVTLPSSSSIRRNSSQMLSNDDLHGRSTSMIRQSRLKSLLARDHPQLDELDINDELYASELYGRSPYYRQKQQSVTLHRQNRLRGILTRQLRSRNQSLLGEKPVIGKEGRTMRIPTMTREEIEKRIQTRRKLKEQQFSIRSLFRLPFVRNLSILLPPPNPLDEYGRTKERPTNLPAVQFQLNENIGIIGKSYEDFDLIRLIIKPRLDHEVLIPSEFRVNLFK